MKPSEILTREEPTFTRGPWLAPHLCDEAAECDCRSVVCEGYAGSIAVISVGNGLPIDEGGNDAPPLHEAKANGRLIAAAPELYEALKFIYEHIADPERQFRDLYPAFGLNSPTAIRMARDALAKATGEAK